VPTEAFKLSQGSLRFHDSPSQAGGKTHRGFCPECGSPIRKSQANAYAVALAPNPLAGIELLLKRSHVPARIVWGMADKIFSQASPDYLDRTFPHSRGVRRIVGAKLFFPEEYPELIAEEALTLWRA
jgi:pimeloyl-ACP methyl ester carboxylesterase